MSVCSLKFTQLKTNSDYYSSTVIHVYTRLIVLYKLYNSSSTNITRQKTAHQIALLQTFSKIIFLSKLSLKL